MSKFKRGDRVRYIKEPFYSSLLGYYVKDKEYTVASSSKREDLEFLTMEETDNYTWNANNFELASKYHKHHDLIIAWAKGATIQGKLAAGVWVNVRSPKWRIEGEYRIKPEPKPDYTHCRHVSIDSNGHAVHVADAVANVKYTFDGETGELKAVELVK